MSTVLIIFDVDINECNTTNGGCAHMCNNTIGSFFCSCSDGYIISNSFLCEGIDIKLCLELICQYVRY